MEKEKTEPKSEVIVVDKEKLERIKEAMRQAGADHMHILTDFDRTLTRDTNMPSLISNLRDPEKNPISGDYTKEADALYQKYRPIEIDPNISLEEKKKAMHEWWRLHFELLIKYGLSKDNLESLVESDKIKLRDDLDQFMAVLKKYQVPIVIMSASGLGEEMIAMCLAKNNLQSGNVHIVSNAFEWDEAGKAVVVREPIITSTNKDETVLRKLPFYSEIRDRENVILLGDNIEDVAMASGINHQNIIKIGFLNKNVTENLEKYKENFDVVIIGDGPMDFVNELLREVLESK